MSAGFLQNVLKTIGNGIPTDMGVAIPKLLSESFDESESAFYWKNGLLYGRSSHFYSEKMPPEEKFSNPNRYVLVVTEKAFFSGYANVNTYKAWYGKDERNIYVEKNGDVAKCHPWTSEEEQIHCIKNLDAFEAGFFQMIDDGHSVESLREPLLSFVENVNIWMGRPDDCRGDWRYRTGLVEAAVPCVR